MCARRGEHHLPRGERPENGAHDSRLHPNPGAAVATTPNAKHHRDLRQRGASQSAPPPLPPANPTVPGSALIGDADGLMSTRVARPRVCVLCGDALRAGQHMLRVHGSTIHARCTNTGR
jgi:hypothetical protein